MADTVQMEEISRPVTEIDGTIASQVLSEIISGKIPSNATTRNSTPPPKIDLADMRMSPEPDESQNDQKANDAEEEAKPDLPTVTEAAGDKTKVDKKKDKTESNKKSKEDKSIEHVLKALSTLKSPEEKLLALCKKYATLLEEQRVLQHSYKVGERKNFQVLKEKEQLQTEHSKAILTRSRLESLCRELQRQNKIVKDESLIRVREEEEKRKEVSAKFQTTFNEITGLMQDSNQKSGKLREENIDLAQKLKSLIEQYEMREQHVDKVLHQKELEAQLSDAKLAKATMIMKEEREQLLQDKHRCLQELAEYQKKCHELTTNEVQLRTQLNLYTDKYEEFQSTLNKSNEMFTHFKKEMDQMSKKIKKLEKETGNWRSRWESSNKALLDMATEKQQRDGELVNSAKKILQLEKLCRALQTERQAHLNQIKLLKTPITPSATLAETIAQAMLPQESSQLPTEKMDSCDEARASAATTEPKTQDRETSTVAANDQTSDSATSENEKPCPRATQDLLNEVSVEETNAACSPEALAEEEEQVAQGESDKVIGEKEKQVKGKEAKNKKNKNKQK